VRHLPSGAASGGVIEAAVRLLPSAVVAFLRVVRPSVPAVAIAAFRLVALLLEHPSLAAAYLPVAPSAVLRVVAARPAPVQASA